MKRSASNLAWVLLGILALAAVLISLGRREAITDPRADNFGPSGLSAFAELLKSNGYQVVSTDRSLPKLSDGDIVVACLRHDPHEIDVSQSVSSESSGASKLLSDFVTKGGRAMLIPLDPDFESGSASVGESPFIVRNSVDQNSRLSIKAPDVSSDDALRLFLPDNAVAATIWERENGQNASGVVDLAREGKGTVVSIADGAFALNRFIDQAQNASFLMNLVSTVAPKGSRLVFMEATFTDSEPGLIETLGPGAAGIWYQSIFLFVVIVYTLGKRFGLPEEARPFQMGQRQLVEAVADTYRRARSTRVACRAAYDRADLDVRKSLKLASDAPASERDLRITPELAAEFRRTFEGTIDSLPPAEAFARCQALRRMVREYLGRA